MEQKPWHADEAFRGRGGPPPQVRQPRIEKGCLSLEMGPLFLVPEERPAPHRPPWDGCSAFWGAANELCLVFMKRHGKLLIWARNESVEPDRLMNIHLDFSTLGGLISG